MQTKPVVEEAPPAKDAEKEINPPSAIEVTEEKTATETEKGTATETATKTEKETESEPTEIIEKVRLL